MSSDKTTSNDSADEETVDAELDPQEDNVTGEPDRGLRTRDPDPEAIRQVGKKKGAGVLTWLALLLSLVAIAAVALDYLRDQETAGESAQSDAELQTLTASVNATQNALSSLEQSVSALSELDAERGAALDRFGRQLNDRLRQLESLPGRLATIEASMSSLQGISTGARDAWLLAEAEYYMQIANAQLQLARNPELAALALTHADERVSAIGRSAPDEYPPDLVR